MSSWENELFGFLDDLEARAAAGFAAERELELADRSRAEYRQVTLAGRLMASAGSEVTLEVTGVGRLTGALERVAQSWLLLSTPQQDWIVRQHALGSVVGASERAVPEVAWSAVARLQLGSALRRLGDNGERCVVHLMDGRRHEGAVRRVGADFFELVTAEPPRVVLVPYAGLAAVQQRD